MDINNKIYFKKTCGVFTIYVILKRISKYKIRVFERLNDGDPVYVGDFDNEKSVKSFYSAHDYSEV